MKRLGTDDEVLIDVLSTTSYQDLQRVADVYRNDYQKSLAEEVHDETSFNYGKLASALLVPRDLMDARLLNKSIKGLGTDDDLLIELICTRTHSEVQAMLARYKMEFGKDPLKEIEDDTSGNYRKLIIKICTTDRSKAMFDMKEFERDVAALYEAGENQIGMDADVFIAIIGGKPRAYIEQLSIAYLHKHGKTLEAVVKDEAYFNFKQALYCLVTPVPDYMAEMLHKAMAGLGTNDKALVRIIATQKERYLPSISQAYLFKYKVTLKTAAKEETSGDYRRLLCSIVENFAEKVLLAQQQRR